jgi:hypothetical protein
MIGPVPRKAHRLSRPTSAPGSSMTPLSSLRIAHCRRHALLLPQRRSHPPLLCSLRLLECSRCATLAAGRPTPLNITLLLHPIASIRLKHVITPKQYSANARNQLASSIENGACAARCVDLDDLVGVERGRDHPLAIDTALTTNSARSFLIRFRHLFPFPAPLPRPFRTTSTVQSRSALICGGVSLDKVRHPLREFQENEFRHHGGNQHACRRVIPVGASMSCRYSAKPISIVSGRRLWRRVICGMYPAGAAAAS